MDKKGMIEEIGRLLEDASDRDVEEIYWTVKEALS